VIVSTWTVDSLVKSGEHLILDVRFLFTVIHYLAYGSNLHPLRLGLRAPSAMLVGTVTIPDRELTFHKRSVDNSGKCTFHERTGHTMRGAVFAIDPNDKLGLDQVEGLGQGYIEQVVRCSVAGNSYEAFVYVAASSHLNKSLQPYRWYKDFVLAGARYHNFPIAYTQSIEAVEDIQDPDARRMIKNENILATFGGI
jgi:gamma-glutamylcyclotransferase